MLYPMFSSERIERLAPGMVLDIAAELVYWKHCHPHRRFFHARLPFEAYVPTLKFGYDSYLIHHHERLDELVPMLQRRYTTLNAHEQLAWPDAMAIVRAAWKRMGAASD
jgi:hypothetical protein